MTKATRIKIGERIQHLRKEQNISQEDFALMVSLGRSYLSRIETGQRNPSIDVIEKIACGFGMTLSEFLDGVQ